jgi:hypothetical protein
LSVLILPVLSKIDAQYLRKEKILMRKMESFSDERGKSAQELFAVSQAIQSSHEIVHELQEWIGLSTLESRVSG